MTKAVTYKGLEKDDETRVGDIVRLKAGGLDMTVEVGGSEGETKCVWFDGKDQCRRDAFRTGSLERQE